MTTFIPIDTDGADTAQSLARLAHDHVTDYGARSVPHLASLADCHTPPRGSDGARLLSHVAGETGDELATILDDLGPDAFAASIVAAVQRFRDREDDDERAREIAEGAPDVVTAVRWAEFVDLYAWQEDVSEWDGAGAELTDLAALALREIARRLVDALAGEVVELAQEHAADNVSAPSVREIAAEFVDDERVAEIDHPADEPETVVLTLAGGAEITLCDVLDYVDYFTGNVIGYEFAVVAPPAPGDDAHAAEVLETGGDGYEGDPALYSLRYELARLIGDWCHAPDDAEITSEQNGGA